MVTRAATAHKIRTARLFLVIIKQQMAAAAVAAAHSKAIAAYEDMVAGLRVEVCVCVCKYQCVPMFLARFFSDLELSV